MRVINNNFSPLNQSTLVVKKKKNQKTKKVFRNREAIPRLNSKVECIKKRYWIHLYVHSLKDPIFAGMEWPR